jgi:ferric-dicitrate binding protein FerR (iron transport regulator)
VATARPLHEMVNLPVDASADELRQAYEAAMSDATRTGAHQRAVNLSRAFDELSAARRQAVYARHDLPGFRSTVAAPVFTRPRPPRRDRRRIERALALALLVVMVLASVIVVIHYRHGARGPATGPSVPAISISAPAPTTPVLPVAPTPVGRPSAN